MINITKERLIIKELESLLKRCRAKGMDEEQLSLEIYKTIILPIHNDIRDEYEWVNLLASRGRKPN